MGGLKMEMPANFTYIPGVRACISRIAFNFGFDDRESYQIETIVDEICNNAIEHGSKKKDTKIRLECKFEQDQMELVVTDTGNRKFNVEQVFMHNIKRLQEEISKGLADSPHRGRGLIIVQKLVDKLDIKTTRNGTTVKILKRRHSDAPLAASS
ncbi:MAG: ATP-binding protein [Candidatus Omnitrophota bacterium]|jgi:anti-sigma regulatory factor (Ser/Thr protein kinase)|nr:ATP-binding protein [Candidatus Omnitrophota bacterium]